MSCTAAVGACLYQFALPAIAPMLASLPSDANVSIGMALTDTLDDLITERRIEPQLAIKILANFDRSITEILSAKVRAKLAFKVNHV